MSNIDLGKVQSAFNAAVAAANAAAVVSASKFNQEISTMNTINNTASVAIRNIIIAASDLKGIEVDVKMWYSTLENEPGIMHVYGSSKEAGRKMNAMTFSNGYFATEIRAMIGAASDSMRRFAVGHQVESVSEDGTNDLAIAKITDESWVNTADNGRYVFPVIDGSINPALQIVREYRPGLKGGKTVAVIHSSFWGLSQYVGLQFPVGMPGGISMVFAGVLAKPQVTGWYEVRAENGELGQPMPIEDDGKESVIGDRMGYREAYHQALYNLAGGANVSLRCGSYLDKRTGSNSNFIVSKARQLEARATMTRDEVVADRMRITNNAQVRKTDAQTYSIMKNQGTLVQVEGSGEDASLAGSVVTLVVNGAPVEIASAQDAIAKLPGMYKLMSGGRKPQQVGSNVYAGRSIRLNQIQIWAAQGRSLVSVS